jgi:poly-gamma-glutamate synthesis protein (capsule biosynthesis protein)
LSCNCNKGKVFDDIPLLIYSADSTVKSDVDDKHNNGIETCSVILTGDTMLSRNVEWRSLEENNFDLPFTCISGFLHESDIVFTNLESPLTSGKNLKKGLQFRGDPRFAAALKRAGVTIVSLANNHIMDQGVSGLDETITNIEKTGILYIGADRSNLSDTSVIIKINNLRIGFLAFTDCLNSLRKSSYGRDRVIDYKEPSRVLDAVKKLKKKTDVVVVSLHWGIELSAEPAEQQRMLAEKIVDAGADIIAGHHPHVIQPYIKIGNGHVFFSLGNLIFDQMSKEETRSSILIKVIIEKKKIEKIEAYPLQIGMAYNPDFCRGDKAVQVFKSLLPL